jgi:hypothetical protein
MKRELARGGTVLFSWEGFIRPPEAFEGSLILSNERWRAFCLNSFLKASQQLIIIV